MAWQASTLRPASLEEQCCGCNDLSFARIIPSNGRALIEAAFLAEQNKDGNLGRWHRKFFHSRNIPSTDSYTSTDSCSKSDMEDDYSRCWESHYGLNLEHLSPQATPLTFRIGSGTPDTDKEDDEVAILTSYPGRSTHRVASVHCAITFGRDGVCLIKALSSTQPTIIFIDNEPLILTLGETHVLCYRTNRFTIGKLEYTFVYNRLGKDAHVVYTEQRNTLYKTVGLSPPDPRVWEFPSAGETRIHGPAVMQVGDGGGISESVRVGVHARTGRALAVKAIRIGAVRGWNDVLDGLQALISFQNERGLQQALEVRCAHGHRADIKDAEKQEGILMPFCNSPFDTVEIFTELAPTNFHEYGAAAWTEKGTPFKVIVLRDILHGLKTLHAAGYMHRGISEHNLLIVSEDPPVTIISKVEQSIQAKTSVDQQIGPAHIRAPEMNGSEYGTTVDIWNLAFVAMSMFFPVVYKDATNFGAVQDESWYTQIYRQLDMFRQEGAVEAWIEQVLRAMLDRDPHQRPTAVQALALLPDFNWERMAYEDLPTISDTISETLTKRKAVACSLDEPSRKLRKQTNEEDVTLGSDSNDSEVSGDSDDSKSNEQDRFDSALQTLRRLPPNSDLHELLEAIPKRVALVDLVPLCKGKDAQLIRRMLQGKKELKEVLGLEIPSDSEDGSLISVRQTCEIDDSSAQSKTSACQQRPEGSTLLAISNRPDQKTNGSTSRGEEIGAECKKTSQPTCQLITAPKNIEQDSMKEIECIDLVTSEEE